MGSSQYGTIISTILSEDKTKWWRISSLVAEAKARSGMRSSDPPRHAINTMVALNQVESDGRRSSVRWMDPTRQSQAAENAALKKAGEELEQARAMVAKAMADLADANKRADETRSKERVVEVQIKDGNKTVKKIKDIYHKAFEEILTLAKARKNIFIYGPTGCGKSHVAGQVAKALNLRFAFVSCTAGMSEGHLAGKLLPVGDRGTFEYVIAEFVLCYEEGGVFLLDEMDAADPNVLLIINAALANGRMAVPNRPKKPYAVRHKDFICMAAANTVGTGADRMYSGRNKLDGATLSRFQIGKVYMDYDENVELIVCPNVELRARLTLYRNAVREHGLERFVDTRFMKDAHDMVSDFGWSFERVDQALFEGWRADEVNKVKSYYNSHKPSMAV